MVNGSFLTEQKEALLNEIRAAAKKCKVWYTMSLGPSCDITGFPQWSHLVEQMMLSARFEDIEGKRKEIRPPRSFRSLSPSLKFQLAERIGLRGLCFEVLANQNFKIN